ncbi:putative ABC transport system ATP-binding protein [Motilibacter rhizosphaerae]|uniref:Putative ABC transport system ATP-binding protein n=1 Tax=Motilibacter rhizosphaerae TaxID=598652 RepID=A0A4Q7NS66_9ACTN|nr:ATP-binding cassette domain-containing protein [Motilibacter rhizosphaerae]RZS89931.1 putative ABC transport system ATP-binding protein [Motilibacter rhizosphaerae]
MSAAAAARCSGVVRIYAAPEGDVHALKGVDLQLPAGSLTALTGPSGSGKTSLLRILAAQDRPTAGTAEIAGTPLGPLSRRGLRALRRRSVGFVLARPSDNLQPQLTALGHLRAAGRMRGLRGRPLTEAADELLGLLELGHRAEHRPDQLSGGEQQRLALAQAVVGGPQLLIADEPTGELDEATADDVLRAVRALTARGTTVLLATHDPRVEQVADRVLAMRSGTIAGERVDGRHVAVIDPDGRVQLPDDALARFPGGRVLVTLDERGVRLEPPA